MASENPNIGFIGFVTRKDKDTGVNLLAKIVTPNRKRSINKLVRVKVKANALDDYSCCVIDHAAMKKIIEESQDLESVSESFQFLYNGEHGTSITYAIEKLDENSAINKYLSEDGTLSGRPKYSPDGVADAVGYIRITVTKNDAEVSSRIMVRVKGMTADEVLNSDKVYSKYKGSLAEFLWDSIVTGTNNGLYSAKGYTEIQDKLNFKSTNQIFVPEISDIPIECAWNIDYDEVGDFMNNDKTKFPGIYQLPTTGRGSRICMAKDDENYGHIYQPSYRDTCDHLSASGFAKLIETNENEARDRRFRIGNPDSNASNGKLCLRAKLTLGNAQPVEVTYMCATTSKTMTTNEVADFIQSIIKIGFNGVWQDCDGTPIPIYVPLMSEGASGAIDQKISIYGNGHYTALTDREYKTLALDRLTLSNVVGFKGNPGVYKVEKVGNNYEVSTSTYDATTMFEPVTFVSQTEEIDGLTVADNIRVLTIPVGNAASKTGLYKADEILNTYPDLVAFAVKFRIEVQALGSGQDSSVLTFEKVFTLSRLP